MINYMEVIGLINRINKRYLIGSVVISILFSIIFTVGLFFSRLYSTSFYSEMMPNSIVGYVLLGAGQVMLMIPLFYCIIYVLVKYEEIDERIEYNVNEEEYSGEKEKKTNSNKFSYKIFFITESILLTVYVFFLYACYPGFFGYDAGVQITQVMYEEIPYSAHHPLLHTLIMGGLVNLGYHLKPESLKFGLFLYNFFQIFVCSLSFAFSLEYIYRSSKKKTLYIVSLLFYLFCPAIVLFSITTTKDSLCYCSLLVGCILLYQIFNEKKSSYRKWIFCGIFLVFACLLRNNILLVIVLFAGLTLLLIKDNRKKFIILYLSVILVSIGINKMLIVILDASSISSVEMLSVPIQQLARVYMEVGPSAFTDEEMDILNRMTMIGTKQGLEYYSPFLSDPVKYAFAQNIDELKNNLGQFLLIWIKKGFQYPKIYFMAFASNTYQAWYPGTSVYSAYGYDYFEIGFDDVYYRQPKIKAVYDWLCNMYVRGDYRNVFGLRIVSSMGTYFCLMIFSMVLSVIKKNRKQFAILLILAITCLSYFVGPLSSVRYYLVLFYFAPLMGLFNLGKLKFKK